MEKEPDYEKLYQELSHRRTEDLARLSELARTLRTATGMVSRLIQLYQEDAKPE